MIRPQGVKLVKVLFELKAPVNGGEICQVNTTNALLLKTVSFEYPGRLRLSFSN